MSALGQLRTNLGIVFRARRNRFDLVRALLRRPQLAAGTIAYEVAVASSAKVDPRLKILAELKAASIVACEYCLDIGSALARHEGLRDAQLRTLSIHQTSGEFDATEQTVLDLADAMTRVPAVIDDSLRARLDACLSRTQQIELMAVIAWENQRARLNQALGVRSSGFSDGEFCVRPDDDGMLDGRDRSAIARS